MLRLPARRPPTSLAPLAGGTRVDAGLLRRDGVGGGWVNPNNGQGSLRDTSVWTSYEGGGRLSGWQVKDLLRTDGVAHRICFREPQDAMREGFEVRGSVRGIPLENDPEQQKAWSGWLRRLGVPAKTVQAKGLSKGHGGAAWVLWVEDGRRSDQPIDWANVRDIKWIKVVRGGRDGLVQPQTWGMDPSRERFEEPLTYNVSFPRGGSGIFHWHRVLVWQGEVIDESELVNNNGWGESVLDRVWTALARFGSAHQYAIGALLKLSQAVFSSQYLQNALEAGRGSDAQRRLEDVDLGAGLYGAIGIGPNEAYQVVGRPIGGVDGLLEKMIEILVMYTDQPEIVLRGKRPGGLSTAADGEFRGWYDAVAAKQEPDYSPNLVRLIEIGSRAALGPTGGVPVIDAGIHWPDLWQLTESEELDNRLKAAQARAADLQAQTITTEESRTDPDLDEWYQLGTLTAPPEDAALQEGEAPPQDIDVLPAGEQLISIREAADILGYRSTQAARAFSSQHGALFKIGQRFKVARSLLMAGLRSAQVEQSEPATPSEGQPGAA